MISALVAAFVVLALPSPTSVAVQATGVAAVQADAGRAADEALRDAQRLAVEQGAGVLVRSETTILNFELVRDLIRIKAAGYLARYEVVSRETKDDLVRVTIRGWVKLAPLAADLYEIDAVAERLGRPRLVVLLNETESGKPADGQPAAREAERLLGSKGFDLVDSSQVEALDAGRLARIRAGDKAAMAKAAADLGVEVVVAGRCDAALLDSPVAGTFTGGAKIEATAWWAETGEQLASGSVDLGARPEHPGHTAFDAAGALSGVRRKAVEELFYGPPDPFVGQILASWLRQPTVVRVALSHVPFDERARIVEAVRADRAVQEVISRGYRDEVLTIEVRGMASAEALVDAVSKVRVGDWRVAITETTGRTAKGEWRRGE